MQNNYPHHPLFAPASQQSNSQQQFQDDIDFNEIFAEYFSSEFDDPLNAYTSSMANYSNVPNVMAQQQQSSIPINLLGLPTGGIRTAFHSGQSPPAKRTKQEDEHQANLSTLQQNQQMALLQLQQQLQQQQQQQQQYIPPVQTNNNIHHRSGVNLPVGVGIRLGGVGGVSPATAMRSMQQQQQQQQQQQEQLWGGDPHQTEERRQRNREHAKRSRVRKKFMLESLQEQVRALQRENQNLRMMVQEHIPEEAMKIIAECCTSSPILDDLNDEDADDMDGEFTTPDLALMQSLVMSQKCFVLSDPKLPDNPIVFASPGFYKLTGYTSGQVLGRNCRFLQGPGTDAKHIDIIRKAIATGSDANVCVLNYKADGTPFWNQFFIAALRDSDNNIVNYVGVQCEVEPNVGANALEEKVNAMLPLQGKED